MFRPLAIAGIILSMAIGSLVPVAVTAKDSSLKPGTRRYADGTVVRRNPDGSIETSDDSPIVQSWGGSPGKTSGAGSTRKKTARQARPRAKAARTAARRPANKAVRTGGGGGDVYVRRNADGSIETFDSD